MEYCSSPTRWYWHGQKIHCLISSSKYIKLFICVPERRRTGWDIGRLWVRIPDDIQFAIWTVVPVWNSYNYCHFVQRFNLNMCIDGSLPGKKTALLITVVLYFLLVDIYSYFMISSEKFYVLWIGKYGQIFI